ncbi:calpain-A [Lingula anatina]|uniref:Calpain-A n=1 Tax=Lingula anatina TaxID=7574 RepID=A0A2R2MIP4_LINAN|nr:calpain-A [Lingula anatina]|eukprot:XP_023930069.1 calpain-A [Lingula anatina]
MSSGHRTVTTTYRYGGPGGKTETRTITIGGDGGGGQFRIGDRFPDFPGFEDFGFPDMPGFKHSGPAPGPRPVPVHHGGGYPGGNKPAAPGPKAPATCIRSTGVVKPDIPTGATTVQNFEELKAQCLREGRLFEDPEFPAINQSIFYSRAPPRPFQWKRPHELCSNPDLFVGGASRFDVQQGELGDCWLLAAIASLSLNKELLHKVVPPNQSFADGEYAGIFVFKFWRFGKWVDVVVDDRLPTYNNRLVFMHSADSNEFWSAMLEKAYAKLCGSYEALKGGSTCEAMEDFTGGVTEMFDLRQPQPPNLFQIMQKAFERSSLMGCSIEASPHQLEAELSNGLIMGHAYSITSVKMVDIKTPRMAGKIPLIRIRNPWGNEAEWKGAWGDKSPEWNFISEAERQEIGLQFDDDGEFWMSFKDFASNFQKLEICNLGPDALTEDELGTTSKKKWEASSEEGGWKRRVNAGGCRNYLDTFWTNPQYRISVTDPDEDDDDNTCTIIVGLMQKDRRKKKKEGLDLLTVGYAIYLLKDPDCGPLDLRFFKYNASFAKSPSFINMREVCGRHKLPPGSYAIIPSTFEPNQEGDFLLRIFTEKANTAAAIDEKTGISDVQNGFPHKPGPQAPVTPQDEQQTQKLRETFHRVAGEDMEIDAHELRDVLNAAFMREFKFDGFSMETCRSMVAMMDVDQSGKLGFEEFQKLWNDLRLWKSVFKQFDKDMSGTLNSYELRNALNNVGMRVSNQTFNALVMRFADKHGAIFFDDFILCAVRLKTMFDTFTSLDPNKTGAATFTLDQFIQTTMYS